MDQLAELVWGLMVVIGILSAFGAAAAMLGVDSRRGVGDSHTTSRISDWW